MRRYPSPSLVVSITALIVALGGAGYSAAGGNFILGANNSATTRSSLAANFDGRTLQLSNSNAGTSATPLALLAAPGRPPFTVNSATKVAKLNADASAPGFHIVYIDLSHQVDIEMNSADTIRIHNGSTGQRTGKVTLIW